MLANETLVQAHGTSTPQNRVTESDVLSRVATAFGLDAWSVSAVKSQLGHSQGTAGGDQLAVSLGAFASQIAPGIETVDSLAPDVVQDGLDFVLTSREQRIKAALINAKGFGGNNSTAAIVSPEATAELLQSRHGRLRYKDRMKFKPDKHVIVIILIVERSRFSTTMVRILWKVQILRWALDSINVPGFGNSLSLDQTRIKYSELIKS